MKTSLFVGKRIGLSVEAGVLRVLVLRGRRVQNWLSYPLSEESLQNNTPSPRSLQSALHPFHSRGGRFRRRVSVCFSSPETLLRTLAIPKLKSQKLMTEAISREAERELPVGKDQAHLFWQQYHSQREGGDFLLLGLHKDLFSRLYASVRSAKLRPRFWELKPLALVRAVGRANVVIVNLEREVTELIMVAQGVPRLVRSLPGQSEMTVEERARYVVEQIVQTVDYYTTSQPEGALTQQMPVVLTGELASDSELTQAVSARSSLPIEPFVCPFTSPPDFPAHTYAVAIGLMLKKGRPPKGKLANIRIDFNVLPDEYRRRLIAPKAAGVAAALTVGAALLFPLAGEQAEKGRELSQQLTTLNQLQRRISAAKASLTKNREVEKRIEGVTGLVTTLRSERNTILSLGGEVTTDVRTLLDLAPSGASVIIVSVKEESILLEGEASSYATVLNYARNLEESGRFPTVAILTMGIRDTDASAGTATFVLSLARKHLAPF